MENDEEEIFQIFMWKLMVEWVFLMFNCAETENEKWKLSEKLYLIKTDRSQTYTQHTIDRWWLKLVTEHKNFWSCRFFISKKVKFSEKVFISFWSFDFRTSLSFLVICNHRKFLVSFKEKKFKRKRLRDYSEFLTLLTNITTLFLTTPPHPPPISLSFSLSLTIRWRKIIETNLFGKNHCKPVLMNCYMNKRYLRTKKKIKLWRWNASTSSNQFFIVQWTRILC